LASSIVNLLAQFLMLP